MSDFSHVISTHTFAPQMANFYDFFFGSYHLLSPPSDTSSTHTLAALQVRGCGGTEITGVSDKLLLGREAQPGIPAAESSASINKWAAEPLCR